jgi:D-alanine--D-alanine ligase
MSRNFAKLKIALLCGGPSLERGISLNSARSVIDHLKSNDVMIQPIYFDQKREAFLLSPAQLYSNTPADFDFKLEQTAQALTEAELERELRRVDIVFPVMHGAFGEDGTIQKWLEERAIPFIGSSSAACKRAFDKYRANEFIGDEGFFTLPSCLLKIFNADSNKQVAEMFFAEHGIKRAIVKPATGGSSIGVFSVNTVEEALEKAELIFSKRMDTRVVIEPFVEGREFTVIILQSRFGLPVAILPTEIETDYTEHQVFDFRKKYLPTRQVTYHCPPRFDDRLIERIQLQSEQLFMLLGMSDFARFDGWVLDNGSVWFSDFNPVSGMEQNSFLFQQAARIGLSHRGVLEHIIARACDRQNISHSLAPARPNVAVTRQPLAVLMGGMTSERQVSLMSGTNVWLKLRNSEKYRPIPYLVDLDGDVWRVPYQLMLNHTVEEIVENCRSAALHEARVSRFETYARERLGLYGPLDADEFGKPERISLEQLLERHERVFIALHGGMGEDGRLQAMLERHNTTFNGPGSVASRLCMDKQATAEAVAQLGLPKVWAIPGVSYTLADLTARMVVGTEALWHELLKAAGARTLIAKPVADGCSSGVVHLYDSDDLGRYLALLSQKASYIPANTFRGQAERIELPLEQPDAIRFEKHMRTDIVRVKSGALRHVPKTGLVEVTVGVVEQPDGMHAFNPSITIADGEVLSVEEKFQGGTGVNLTPPPEQIMPKAVRRRVQDSLEKLASGLGVRGYGRIDAFVNCRTGDIYVIEVNTLPGLTPSTVIFQQALAEEAALYPMQFLELIADNKPHRR